MKVLVTGGAGFIGSHTVDALLARGDSVVCIDNFNNYYNPAIKRANIAEYAGKANFSLREADIRDLTSLQNIFEREKPEGVIHLAARAGVRASIDDPILYEETNVKGTLNLLECARLFGVKKFVSASSSSVYGDRTDGPFKEADNVDNPISPYAATKKAGELLCYTYNHLYKFPIACLRFFTVYGERGRPDMAPLKFTMKIEAGEALEVYGDGSQQRDFTYVGDIVAGILAALDKNVGYNIYNLGNSKPVVLNNFIKEIEQALGKEANIIYQPMNDGDVGLTYADTSKARAELLYDPKVDTAEGVKRLALWYREHSKLYGV